MSDETAGSGSAPRAPDGGASSAGVGLLVWTAVGALVAWNTRSGEAFLRNHGWIIGLVVAFILLLLIVPAIKARFNILRLEARTAWIVFGVLPFIALLVVCIVWLPDDYRVIAIRGVFLFIVVLLPATMYYLFIVTRKDSLFNEYIVVIDRLGLLRPERLKLHGEEIKPGSFDNLMGPRLRVETYLQRFEATYGVIDVGSRDEYITSLLRGLDPGRASEERRPFRRTPVGFTEVFNLATAVPVILATALIALGWLMILPPIPQKDVPLDVALSASLNPVAGPVGFAFLGAYFFALQALFRRYVRRDLRASAYIAVCIRIVLAVIGTWVVVACAAALAEFPPYTPMSQQTLHVVGFTLGVFPQVAWQFVSKAIGKASFAKLLLPSLTSQLPLSDLDGLTVWHESRFEEEDIENIANMATADISDLMLNTRIARARIIDWVDQAMLYVQLGPKTEGATRHAAREALRAHGIRSATSLLVAHERSAACKDMDEFEQLLASEPADKRSRIRTLVDAIKTSPNLEPVLVWKGIERFIQQGAAAPG